MSCQSAGVKVNCSIVTYKNTLHQISHVLTSVTDSVTDGGAIAITVVDNSPADQLINAVSKFGVNYIHLPSNPGFGAAHNIVIQSSLASDCDYHLVLNPDAHFPRQVIPLLIQFLDQHRDVGLVMPAIRYPDGRPQYLCKLLPTPVDLLMRRFLPRLYDRTGLLARYELRRSKYDRVMDVPALSGCFMLIRTSVLREVGSFDERFFMYLEDVDLSRRIGKVARTVFFPHVSITHEYVKGSYKNWKLLFNHIRSAILYFNKWGWLFDPERKAINRRALQEIESIKTSSELQ